MVADNQDFRTPGLGPHAVPGCLRERPAERENTDAYEGVVCADAKLSVGPQRPVHLVDVVKRSVLVVDDVGVSEV